VDIAKEHQREYRQQEDVKEHPRAPVFIAKETKERDVNK
jgi:hypothetical protein